MKILGPILVLLLPLALASGPASAQQDPALTLDQAIGSALVRSPELRAAEAERLRARAARADALGRMLPSLYLSTGVSGRGNLTRTGTDPVTGAIILLPDSMVDQRQSYATSATLTAAWTVFDGGRRLMDASAGRQRSRAALHAAEARRVAVAAEVTLAYLDALEAQALVEVRSAESESADELERTARSRFDVGDVPEIDLLQARLAASEAEMALLEAESQARIARLRLLERAGIPADAGFTLSPPPDAGQIPEGEELVRHALAHSSLLAELRERGAAQRAESRGPAWELLPSVSLLAQWDRSEVGGTREAFTMRPQNTQTFYRLLLSWTPFERPAAFSASGDRARAARLASGAELEGLARALERELLSGAERLRRARALQSRAATNAELAERQREQAEERYRLGVAPMTERLAADALWAEAMRQNIVARYAPLRALAEMEIASGTPLRPETR